jgi:hypothetical protein
VKLRLHRLAVVEIDHEVDYYESKQPGLGAELEDEIDAMLQQVLRFPESAPQWADRPHRRLAVLDRFPFTMPYQKPLAWPYGGTECMRVLLEAFGHRVTNESPA